MTLKIRRVAVLGAGVMGAQIAAHLAGAGLRVHLLDLAGKDAPKDKKLAKAVGKNIRSSPAIIAIEKMKKLKPSPILSQVSLTHLIPGNFEDDMSVLADVDWVIEAVVERLDIKKSIHKQIESYVKPGVPVTTNTSGISLKSICEDLPEAYQKTFFGSHYFNPPRYMRLLELIPHDRTDPTLFNELGAWINEHQGKGIVEAKDTINFVANRIGVYTIAATIRHMDELGLNIETVDALTGKLMGRPASGTFRTMDVVGLDVFAHVAKNVVDLVKDDPYRETFTLPDWVNGLIEQGHLGQKAGSKGAYLKSKDERGKTKILAYRPEAKDYADQDVKAFAWQLDALKIPDTAERLRFVLEQDDPGATLVWRILRDTFSYSALLLENIAHGRVKTVDDAICWGFNWEIGPFALWQALGTDQVLKRMQEDKVKLPAWLKEGVRFYEPDPGSSEWALHGVKSQLKIPEGKQEKVAADTHSFRLPQSASIEDPRKVIGNDSASLLDIGDGVACLVFHSKMNTIDAGILELGQQAASIVNDRFDALVVANDADNFSAGANLKMLLNEIESKDFAAVDRVLRHFQVMAQLFKYAPFPTISCPRGLTLGGGCEVALQTQYSIASAETYAGLVEVGVGVIPGGGGTKELALRAYQAVEPSENGDPMAFLQRAFLNIGMAKVSGSGFEAKEMSLFSADTQVCLSNDHQVKRAKAQVLHLLDNGYRPLTPAQGVAVVGDPGIQTFKLMLYNMVEGRQISPYDAFIGEKVATVLCGGEIEAGTRVSEQHFLDLERRVFVELCQQENTVARIQHMLKKGKPLRN